MTSAVTIPEERPRMALAGTMKALVFHGPNQISLDNIPVPRAGYGEAVLRVTLTTICGTDVHILKASTR